LHAQLKLPAVFVHVAFTLQLFVPFVHSLMSVHVTPLPVYPLLHAQLKLPAVFVHVAFALQLFVPFVHSFTSVHVTPSPE
jgi:hypothetical protein